MITQKYTKYSLLIIAIFFISSCTLKIYAAAGLSEAAGSRDDFASALHAKFAIEEENLRSIGSMHERLSDVLRRQVNLLDAGLLEDAALITEIRSILQCLLHHSKETNILLQSTVEKLNQYLKIADESISLERGLHSRLYDIEAYHANKTGSESTNDTKDGKELMAEGLSKSNALIGIYTSIIDKAPEVLALCATLSEGFRKIQTDVEAAMVGIGSGTAA